LIYVNKSPHLGYKVKTKKYGKGLKFKYVFCFKFVIYTEKHFLYSPQ